MKPIYLLYALCIALLCSCSTTSQRIDENGAEFNSYTPNEKRLIRTGQIAIGFDETQVRMALGKPSRITSDTSSSGTRYIWEYNQLEPDYNIFNSVGVSVNGGFNAGVGVGGTPTRSQLRKRVVFERSNQRVSDFQTYD